MFTKEFLFGAASAAYQVEGAWDKDEKQISNWDVFSKIPGKTFESTNGDVAVDHYHRYKEDVQLMKEMGLQSYRFSISWSRVLTKDGLPNKKGLEFYHNLIDELNANNIVPFVTLYHWDMPNYLEEDGGWTNKKTVDEFLKYAELCFKEFGEKVQHFITFNETVVFCALGYLMEAHPPACYNPKKYFIATHNVFYAHALATKIYKQLNLTGEVGITHVLSPTYAGDTTKSSFEAKQWRDALEFKWYYDPILRGEYPKEVLKYIKEEYDLEFDQSELKVLKENCKNNDFIGVNYYQPCRVIANLDNQTRKTGREASAGGAGNVSWDGKLKSIVRDDCEYTKWGWETYPQALYDGMKDIYERYDGIPIYITENGLGDEDLVVGEEIKDQPRIDYINDHLVAVEQAIKNGINVKGYYAWSFTDLLSWLNGYKKQYGFVYVDHKNDLKRVKKDSYYWYQEVIATRGESLTKKD